MNTCRRNARLGNHGDSLHGTNNLGMASYVPRFLECLTSTKCFATISMDTQQRQSKDYKDNCLHCNMEKKTNMVNIMENINLKNVHVCVRLATNFMSS